MTTELNLNDADTLKLVRFDGVPTWKLCCPMCGTWGYIDDDQFHGRVSTECVIEDCSYHETVDWKSRVSKNARWRKL